MNVPILASSISISKFSPAVIRKVAVSHTKPLRSASRAPVVVKWATSCESPKTRSGLTTSGHLSSHVSGVLRPIFKVERPIERYLCQLHVRASKHAIKWHISPSNENHCLCDVIHTLGFLLCAATFQAMSSVFYDRFSKLNGRSKGLYVSYMPLLVRMPSNAKHCLCNVIHTWRSGLVTGGPYPNLDLSDKRPDKKRSLLRLTWLKFLRAGSRFSFLLNFFYTHIWYANL